MTDTNDTTNTVILDGVQRPVFTVVQLTSRSDPRDLRPVILSRQYFFSREVAEDEAREASKTVPVPQRFTVFDPDLQYLSSWQCGQRLGAFTVEPPAAPPPSPPPPPPPPSVA
jgi:hypothetical protein